MQLNISHVPITALIACSLLPVSKQPQAPLPAKVEPYPVVANITFAEGPTFDSKGNLYFVNYLRNGTIGRMTPDGTVSVWVELPEPQQPGGKARKPMAFGMKADKDDYLIVTDYGGRRLLRVSPTKEIKTLVDSFEGKPLNNPNDVCLDRAGNIYFTDPQNDDKASQGAIYRLAVDGTLKRLHQGLQYPNGLVVGPDQDKLYVAETWTRSVVVFDLAKDGTLSKQRTLYRFDTPTVDGLSIDEAGRIWVARLNNKTVDVLSPSPEGDGKLLASYPVGGDRVTNMAWWGKSLYVTVAGQHSIVRLDVGIRGAK
jgi:sugar lactone lactonase YvrE